MKPGPHRIVVTTPIHIENATVRDSETGGLPGNYGEGSLRPEEPKRMMKYACRDFSCIRGYFRPDKASLSETSIFNLLITRHKTAPDLQGRKQAVWLAVRAVCC